MGKPVAYPAPRFKGPVVMQPQNFAWAPLDGASGVRRKPLGTFSERGMALDQIAIARGASYAMASSIDRRLIFMINGEGKDYRRHTAIRLDSGETFGFAAETDTELLLITLPLIEARAAA